MKDPREIIEVMVRRYAECTTYSDEGSITDVENPRQGNVFRTHFVRPNKFRFEWTDIDTRNDPEPKHCMVWSDGRKSFSRYHFDDYEIEQEKSLEMAIAGATGISHGVAHTIYTLLLNSQRKERSLFSRLKGVSFGPTSSAMGESCYHIRGTSRHFGQIEFWVSRANFALRKTKEYGVITAEFARETDAELKRTDPEMYARFANDEPYTDRYHVTQCRYSRVTFDARVERSIFEPEFED